MTVGAKIRELRRERDITQKQLADTLSVRQTAVSYWEAGKRDVDLDTLKKICDYFQVKYSYFLEDSWVKFLDDASGEGLILIDKEGQDVVLESLLESYDALNQEGREELAKQGRLLVLSGQYIKSADDTVGKEA